MKKQYNLFLTALLFFTRLPVSTHVKHSGDGLQQSARYFSWAGILIGVIGATILFLSQKIFAPALSIAFSMLATILTTGAFHEDGFADCCDAFGGGWTQEKILFIMKDSRLGTYGVVGLIGILGFKFLLLQELFTHLNIFRLLAILIAAHSTSRFMAITIMQQYTYVQDIEISKSKPMANRKLNNTELAIALTGALLPLVFLPVIYACALLPVIMIRWYVGRYFYKWIGGYTGDCLGATQQLCELVFYISCLLIWKFI